MEMAGNSRINNSSRQIKDARETSGACQISGACQTSRAHETGGPKKTDDARKTGSPRGIGLSRIAAAVFLIIFLIASFVPPAFAATETSFQLEIDSLNLRKGVSVNLIVSMKNAQGAKVLGVDGLENFSALSQSSSTSINISGRNTVYQEDIRYTIIPESTGQFTLKANIRYNGDTYETNTLQVNVSDSAPDEDTAESDLFIKTTLSKAEAYLGEKLIVTYELYSRYNIENFGFTDYTSIDGMIVKDAQTDQPMAEYMYVNGVRYAKYTVKQLILDPIKTGSYVIPAFNAQVNVIVDAGPGGVFDKGFGGGLGGFGGFFNRTQAVYLRTEEKSITVKPLPTRGRPADFSGIVGDLSVDSGFSRVVLDYGDSLSLRVKASGNCNLDGVRKLFNEEIPGFTIYETQKNLAESVINNQYFAEKEFEAILVPDRTGKIELAPLPISYFNPVSGKYEEASIPGAVIEVLGEMPASALASAGSGGSAGGGGSAGAGGSAADIKTTRISQIQYAASDSDYLVLRLSRQSILRASIAGGAFLCLVFTGVGLALSRKKQDNTLKTLYKQIMASPDANEIFNLFNAMIKHKYKLSLKASSLVTIQSGLHDAGIAMSVTEILDYMETPEKSPARLKEKIKQVYSAMKRAK